MNEFSLLIGGKLMRGAATLEVINPATEEILATAPRADHVQLDQAVAAAKAAFPAWAATPLRERAALLVKLADTLQTRHGEFARLLTEEQGKPLPNAMGEIARAVGVIRYFASLDLPLKLLKEDATQKVVQQRTPLGVVAAITPWNFPMILLMIKVAPALLAGNNMTSIGAMRGLKRMNLVVPRDMALVGFDDFEWADCFEPQLTVIAQPCLEIGRSAAKMLLERIKKPDREPKTVRHKTELIIRNSCGC